MIRGMLGGSFDPVHGGHLAMAEYVLHKGICQVLHVVPARLSPHKHQSHADGGDRLAMTCLAFAPMEGVVVESAEIHRPAPSYTVDTLRYLSAQHPDDTWVLILGSDNVAGLSSWRENHALGQLAQVAVLSRKTSGQPDDSANGKYSDNLPENLHLTSYMDFHQPVSSSEIRAMLLGVEQVRERALGLLPVAVAEFIRKNDLYRG